MVAEREGVLENAANQVTPTNPETSSEAFGEGPFALCGAITGQPKTITIHTYCQASAAGPAPILLATFVPYNTRGP